MIDPQQVPIVALLFAIGAAGLTKKWVFGWVYDELIADRDFWRETALHALNHADDALGELVRKK